MPVIAFGIYLAADENGQMSVRVSLRFCCHLTPRPLKHAWTVPDASSILIKHIVASRWDHML